MKALAWTVAAWFMIAGSIFINGKLKNDGAIARDTARVADALERAGQPQIWLQNMTRARVVCSVSNDEPVR